MHATPLVILAACGGPSPDPTPDAPPAPVSCRTFGELARTPLVVAGGAPWHQDGITADPEVRFEDGRYRLWFTTVDYTSGTVFDAPDRALGTAYAESTDGVTWDASTFAPVAPHKARLALAPSTWDHEGVETVTLARTAADELTLIHTGDRPDGSYAIGRARGRDGIAWQRDAGPLLEPVAAWEQPVCTDDACTHKLGGVLEPSFVVDDDGTQHIWYAGAGVDAGTFAMRIGHATSHDGGATWQRAAEPVYRPGPAGSWDEIFVSHTNVVRDPAGGYHLFYQGISAAQQAQCDGQPCAFYTPGSIGHAFSADGVAWDRDPAPILVPTGDDAYMVGGPSAVFRDGRLELYYFGIASRDDANLLRAHLARAVATCM